MSKKTTEELEEEANEEAIVADLIMFAADLQKDPKALYAVVDRVIDDAKRRDPEAWRGFVKYLAELCVDGCEELGVPESHIEVMRKRLAKVVLDS